MLVQPVGKRRSKVKTQAIVEVPPTTALNLSNSNSVCLSVGVETLKEQLE